MISGLASGFVGLFAKLHHATIDGASGVELLHVLLDTEPEGRSIEPPSEPWQPEPHRRRSTCSPERHGTTPCARAGVQAAGAADASGRRALGQPDGPGRWPRDSVARTVPTVRKARLQTRLAPPTPFNRTITAHRRFAFRTLKLSDVQFVKRAFGVTVNDVVMALCASVLRTYLGDRDELPGDPLVAMVPVSVRSGGESDIFSNQVSGVTCSLHTDLDDPPSG